MKPTVQQNKSFLFIKTLSRENDWHPFCFLKDSLHSGRFKVTRATVGRDILQPNKVFEFVKLTLRLYRSPSFVRGGTQLLNALVAGVVGQPALSSFPQELATSPGKAAASSSQSPESAADALALAPCPEEICEDGSQGSGQPKQITTNGLQATYGY